MTMVLSRHGRRIAVASLLVITAAGLGLAQTANKKDELGRQLTALSKVYENDRIAQLRFIDGNPEIKALFEEYLKLGIPIDCGNAPATWHLAGAFYQRNLQWGQAIRCHTRALELGLHDGGVYYSRSYCYSRQMDFDKAITDADKAIELEPDDALSYERRAETYVEMKDYEKAVIDYTKAIQIRRQKVKKAASSYDHRWELSDLLGTYQKRANAFFLSKAYDRAIDDLKSVEKQLRPGPPKAAIYRAISAAYRAKGDAKSADKYSRLAEAMDPGAKK
jgi:tetratricopeptide (TPR) repeat protein